MNEQQPPNEGKSTSGRSLLASSYKSFDPYDVGDRYVTFLLDNEPTLEKLTGCVLKDHLKRIDNETNGKMEGRSDDSIEIDAYQLMNLDPVLGNLTLRYPDTLLSLLEDSTVQARKVLRRRMEVALSESMKHANQKQSEKQQSEKQQLTSNKKNQQLLHSLQQNTTYEPRPLRARLTHLPPHHQCCKPTLSSISSSDVGTVLQISGTCVRTGPVRMMETIRTYKCLECGNDFEVQADFGTTNNALPAPIVCPAEFDEYSCKGTNFKIVDRASHHCDYQEIKVQESAGALTRVGSVPRSILIKLTDDLVDKCNPGDEVVVVGSLHAEWQSGTSGFVDNLEIMVGMSVQAHSVRIVNVDEEMAGGGPSMSDLNAFSGSGGLGSVSGNLRERFRREFDAFWNNEEAKQRPFATRDYILRAVCPKLFGMHAVKLGLLLALIGGASVSNDNEYADMSEDGERHLESEHLPIDDNDSTPAPFEAGPVAFNFGGDIDDSDDQSKDNLKRKRDDQSGSKYKSNNQGKAVRSRRRVQSHILLIGDPGTGKSQFLRFAAALSPRSVLTTGTGSSTAGLTCAAIKDSGNEYSLEAGALALADRGVCCIDEFGCMSKEDRTSIHEAMEQQTISVAKAGIVAKLNARATVVAVMNPRNGIYDRTLSLENNARLGSALLSRFDLIFIMLDQAECQRDDNIARFLLQQSISPGSGYDQPQELEKHLNNDGDTNGHWSMEKLRAYIAIIRDKFHPTLTPEASQLLENHYSLCRQSKSDKSFPITVRFLESLIRLSQAHARLMYRNTVLVEDAAAIILLMECTAAAFQDDPSDFIFKNPIDTEFRPFVAADAEFEEDKRNLLARYRNMGCTETDNAGGGRFNGWNGPNQSNQRSPRQNAWDNYGQRGSQPSFPWKNTHSSQPDQYGRQLSQPDQYWRHHQQSFTQNNHASQPDQYIRQRTNLSQFEMSQSCSPTRMDEVKNVTTALNLNEWSPEDASQTLPTQNLQLSGKRKRSAD